jgi:hypothetical protein
MCKTVIKSVTKEVLGMEALQKREEWFDAECKKKNTMEKNEAYKKMQQRSGTSMFDPRQR